MNKKRRLGKFFITLDLKREPENFAHFLDGVVVLQITDDYYRNSSEYTAYHPDFDEIQEGYIIPEYQATFDSKTGAVTWKKLS